jgi:hypothetical protein
MAEPYEIRLSLKQLVATVISILAFTLTATIGIIEIHSKSPHDSSVRHTELNGIRDMLADLKEDIRDLRREMAFFKSSRFQKGNGSDLGPFFDLDERKQRQDRERRKKG